MTPTPPPPRRKRWSHVAKHCLAHIIFSTHCSADPWPLISRPVFRYYNYCFADHAEKIRLVMSNISLPESCFPAWANVIPEDEWKAKLVSQITGSVDDNSDNGVHTTEADSSSSTVTAGDSTTHDIQEAS